MKPTNAMIAALLLCGCLAAAAQPDQGRLATIRLDDGSTLTGRLQRFDGHIVRIETASLGNISIDAERVRDIRFGADRAASPTPSPPADNAGPLQPQVQAMRKRVVRNPQAMNRIMPLRDNPEVQAILADPELMSAINSGDLTRLMNDPRLRRLAEDPQMQAVIRSLLP